MLGAGAKSLEQRVFGRPAAFLVRLHVHPNVVTVFGAAAITVTALVAFPMGWLWQGALIVGAIATTDALDGTMARITGSASKWGAFLDSTLDRVSDAAVFAALTIYLARLGHLTGVVAGVAALSVSLIVPYARARAGALGFEASVGIAERADRLIVALAAALATGLGAPWQVLAGALGLLAVASLVTVGQRAWAVFTQARAEGSE
jgi:CDP-diacylglycerol--glycerol-3-phosphate 3-phosphatidyltransferase